MLFEHGSAMISQRHYFQFVRVAQTHSVHENVVVCTASREGGALAVDTLRVDFLDFHQ